MASFGLMQRTVHCPQLVEERCSPVAGCSGRGLPVIQRQRRGVCSATNGVQRGRVLRRTAASTDVVSFVDPNDIRKPAAAAAGPAVDKVGVLLLNLGGPEKLDDVKPFLYNLFADPEIIRLPAAAQFLQPLLATIISTLRAPKSAEGYEAIGGGSPLRRITDEQAEALAESLRAKGQPANVYVGMRYWHPYTEEALEHIKADGVTRLVILPLYPQFSISTSGSSLRLLESLFKSDIALKSLRHTVIPSWYQRRGYVSAMADLIVEELKKFRDVPSVELFFSAHGVPKSYVEEAGDPYKEEMEECVRLITDEVKRRGFANTHTLAYQSRVGPAEWLKPYTDESIKELGKRGVKSLLAVPISFVSEHIETLEEIDMEYRELAEESGIRNWGRVPALNTNAAFIDDLADAVMEALPYVGCLAGPTDSLVPLGDLEMLLQAYDRERRTLPSPVVMWEWGWTKSAETWNGRIAMIAIIIILALEAASGQSILKNLFLAE
ncbi:hypothetical protein CHLRE_07g339750v5 [Chlamydomonas reinhardtii]|uniref:Ferrochelatase n=1 Tax=Chlamydomonas reinhardtii TaxID=3055 RepID=Q9ATG8_CHLRE|nr:uncharacterized protein CHLRE_07g339750v5 [Chlamydomonas reinhardtii]AAK16728.1 ferrochelatase [Chlamydomonas reinhardtii]PNW81027.1 hypothetical protein CHLRE_07g339750v5 [Chlamydomonas reinhardtii]|eukprot:XP_001692390.1 ferrochelatase [Chlamydomonas reinhardtii]